MENDAQEAPAKPDVVTIAKYGDRIPTDKSAAEAASIHGASGVFVNDRCYADILAEQELLAAAAAGSPANDPVDNEADAKAAAAADAQAAADAAASAPTGAGTEGGESVHE